MESTCVKTSTPSLGRVGLESDKIHQANISSQTGSSSPPTPATRRSFSDAYTEYRQTAIDALKRSNSTASALSSKTEDDSAYFTQSASNSVLSSETDIAKISVTDPQLPDTPGSTSKFFLIQRLQVDSSVKNRKRHASGSKSGNKDKDHTIMASIDNKRTRRLKFFGVSDSRVFSMSSASSLEVDSDEDSDDDEDDESEDDDQESGINIDISGERIIHPILKLPKRWRRAGYKSVIHQIDEVMKDFRLTDDTYRDIMALLNTDMTRGLQQQTHHSASVRMYPTYVRSLPDGTEQGRFIALDLGGTNFRVLLVDLKGPEPPEIISKIFLIPMRIMLGSGKMLFDHIAKCIAEFMETHGLKGGNYPMGFTFSFPCYQEGLASARLVKWTKGFKCAGVEGEDVVKLLHEAIEERQDISIECKAIINDPVGALMAAAHTDKNCHIGLILGTGTNCCYTERLEKVELWDGDHDEPKQVIVNTEWGAFGDSGVLNFMRNAFDNEVDRSSLNPGHQLFEKMISGMYMGEIVRLVLCELTSMGLLFGGEGSEELFSPNRFLTKYISEIESDDPEGRFPNTKLVLQELDLPHFTGDDCRHVQHVCWQVSQRAAYLAGTAVATVISRLDREDVTVAVDGSLYRFHPHFKDLMNKKIAQLVKPHQQFKLVLSHDGSGKGAALVAAVALKSSQAQSPGVSSDVNKPSLPMQEENPADQPSTSNGPIGEFTGPTFSNYR